MKEIPIFFSFDNNYVIPAAVAFYSLLNKAEANVFYRMYVLHSDITSDNQSLLHDIVKKSRNAELEFRNISNFLHNEWENGVFGGKQNKQFNVNTIVKCFAAKFFPEYKKILYSDVDVVFMDDISELIDVNLEGRYIGAVKNAFMKKYPEDELGHLSREHYEIFKDTYFAGGIWVLNTDEIRKDNIEETMMNIISDNAVNKKWPDQDIMNIACDNKVEYLSLRYISYPYMLDKLYADGFVSHFSIEECIESIISPKILHYASVKPWNGDPRKKEIWLDIFNKLNIPKTDIFRRVPKKMSWRNKLRYKIWLKLGNNLKKKGLI